MGLLSSIPIIGPLASLFGLRRGGKVRKARKAPKKKAVKHRRVGRPRK